MTMRVTVYRNDHLTYPLSRRKARRVTSAWWVQIRPPLLRCQAIQNRVQTPIHHFTNIRSDRKAADRAITRRIKIKCRLFTAYCSVKMSHQDLMLLTPDGEQEPNGNGIVAPNWTLLPPSINSVYAHTVVPVERETLAGRYVGTWFESVSKPAIEMRAARAIVLGLWLGCLAYCVSGT